VVEPDSTSISVPVSDKLGRIEPQSERDVRAFVAVYKARGHGPFTVARPVGSPNEKSARHVSEDILRIAAEAGIDPVDIMPQSYKVAGGEPSAPILLSFTRFVASTGPCGDWSHNYASTLRNTEMPNFGCSTQNNIAAMLEDPHDLIAPRGMGPADAERRAKVFDKYRKGETTVTDRKDTEKSDVAKVGSQ
jgi:pilus assembly protein CpaD